MTIVDIHCHTFNANDVPVKGFIDKVAGQKVGVARVLAWTIDQVIQGLAPDAEEIARLDELLEGDAGGLAETEDIPDPWDELEDDTEAYMEQLAIELPDELAQAEEETAGEVQEELGDEAAEFLGLSGARRYVKWAGLFGKSRLQLTTAVMKRYPEVELFTPLVVDLRGLDDEPETSPQDQIEIHERINRLSLKGRLRAHVHPFVGFDPRRDGGIDLVRAAVLESGFVGVKMYPPMGFLPFGNTDAGPTGMDPAEAAAADAALASLYDFCVDYDVPITAHGNASNFAHEDFVEFSGPDKWKRVLEHWPDLHLNLGHFGGSGRGDHGHWPAEIAKLASGYDHLYGDTGNHSLGRLDEYFEMLARLFDPAATDTASMHDRFMFGTDWYMVASHNNFEMFLQRFRSEYAQRYPDRVGRFMGEAALDFLGFSDPTNKNTIRVKQRYQEHGIDNMPAWLK